MARNSVSIESMYEAVFTHLAGEVLTNAKVIGLLSAEFPDANPASFNVSDHAPSNRQAKQYAVYCFERVQGGYKVLPRSEWQYPVNAKQSGSADLTAEITRLRALLAAKQSQPATKVLPQIAAGEAQSKANGAAKQ